ncbi:MAG: ATP-dependent zinc metalloprotease FtsH [Bacteroidota bacterium]
MADINSNDLKPKNDNNPIPKKPNMPKFNFYWIYGVIAVVMLVLWLMPRDFAKKTTWFDVRNNMILTHDVERIMVVNKERAEVFIKKAALNNAKYKEIKGQGTFVEEVGPHYYFEIGDLQQFEKNMDEVQKDFTTNEKIPVEFANTRETSNFLVNWLPILLLIGFTFFMLRRMGGNGGGGGAQIFNIGKSRAQLFDKESNVNITFKDVAGLDEAKEEVMEIVDFLKNPKKYTTLGGKIPKGALLIGSPGTGKTLLAKAVAGEAGVPFFSLSGSDFVEMFVGVGASRVRDLFKQAKEKAPCIIFIDEIDAVGRARGKNAMQGANDERENTLNQLLTEMDGFGTDIGIIILAATNRPDILDSALLRPGRFDRQISIDKPDLKGRAAIFRVHLKPLKLANDVEETKLATQTAGFAGAEIMNVCNEAALIAARRNKEMVDMADFQAAIDRVIGGLEKKNKVISDHEKQIVAYHEAGHAIAGWFLEHVDPLVKVSIVPRGVAALGYAQYLPKDQYLYTTEQMVNMMCMTLGGRVAEDIIFNRISTGAQNDLERITKMAYAMVTVYGMNDKVGNLSFYDANQEYGFQKPYSDKTAELIDQEVRLLIDTCYQKTKALLTEKKDLLEILAQELLKKEIIFQADLEVILGKRPFEYRNQEIEAMDAEKLQLDEEAKRIAEKKAENNQPLTSPLADTHPDA